MYEVFLQIIAGRNFHPAIICKPILSENIQIKYYQILNTAKRLHPIMNINLSREYACKFDEKDGYRINRVLIEEMNV